MAEEEVVAVDGFFEDYAEGQGVLVCCVGGVGEDGVGCWGVIRIT